MKIRNKLCLADSGLPLCLVFRALKLPQFEVSILLGVSRHLPPPSSPDADQILVGLMGPPFSSILCPTIIRLSSYFCRADYNQNP